MKSIIWSIIILVLILLASYIALSQEPNSFNLKKFVIEGNKENIQTSYNNMNTFVIGQKPTGRSRLMEAEKQTQKARRRNIIYRQREEEIEKCIKRITKNWKRTYYERSYEQEYDNEKKEWKEPNFFYEREKEFWGYDENEDAGLKWELRNRALNGEKLC